MYLQLYKLIVWYEDLQKSLVYKKLNSGMDLNTEYYFLYLLDLFKFHIYLLDVLYHTYTCTTDL